MLVSIRDNYASFTWEKLCHCHFGTIVPVSLGNDLVSQCHFGMFAPAKLGTIAPVSSWNNRASVTSEQLYRGHLGTIASISLG